MAKVKMLCPFSKKLCQECPQYRGRHYYLCFSPRYRGCLTEADDGREQRQWSSGAGSRFDVPLLPQTSPSWLCLNEFVERRRK